MDQEIYEDLRTQALAGSDDDLEPEDKRARPDDLPPQTAVTLSWGQAGVVLCPGRGREWVCVGWLEGDARNVGTFLLSDLQLGPSG